VVIFSTIVATSNEDITTYTHHSPAMRFTVQCTHVKKSRRLAKFNSKETTALKVESEALARRQYPGELVVGDPDHCMRQNSELLLRLVNLHLSK
jgi:hypothetical protein